MFRRSTVRVIHCLLCYFLGVWTYPFVDSSLSQRDRFGVVKPIIGERVSLTSLSPNEEFRTLLVELPSLTDRNFEIRLQNVQKEIRTIYRSPDEGKPYGSERFLWSTDSTQFALVGKKFISRKSPKLYQLESGETFYLIYDLKTNDLSCNVPDEAKFACKPIDVNKVKAFSP
jgi:hypothetical protein